MIVGLGSLLALFCLLWLVSLWLRDSSIVDICWGPAIAFVAIVYMATTSGAEPRRLVVVVLTMIWGVRLAWHIGSRNVGHDEDARYAAWRTQHGPRWWWRSLFQVFLLQGTVAWIVSWPLYFAIRASTPSSLTWLDWAGIILFGAGFLHEAIADRQLTMFKRDPANRGTVMDHGLWRYSRHPNYFGEAVLWWGLGLIGVTTPGGFIGLAGPALITWLLLRVSGVTMLEAGLTKSKPGYADYVARTSSFIPMPRR